MSKENVSIAMNRHFSDAVEEIELVAKPDNDGVYTFDVRTDDGKTSSYVVFATEESKRRAIQEYLEDSIVLFDSSFIQFNLVYDNLPIAAIEAIKLAPKGNDIICSMIKDWNATVLDAIDTFGYGSSLGHYDQEAFEVGDYYVYQE